MRLRFILILLFQGLFVNAVLASEYPAVDVEMQLQQVSQHVYYVQGATGIATDNKGFISNAAVVFTDAGIVVFDTLGSPSLAEKLIQAIRKVSDKPIKQVYISHYHADHIYGAQVFKAAGAMIYAPAGAENYYESEGAQVRLNERRKSLKPWVNEQTEVVVPNVLVKKDTQFSLGGVDFEVIQFGSAHSHGDLALFVKQDGVLLSGDLIFTGRVPFVGGDDIDNWIAKIEYLNTVPANVIVPGHGSVFKDLSRGAALTKAYLVLLRDSMNAAVEELMVFDDAYNAVDWNRFSALPAFKNANRGNAYRVFLAAEAKALAE